MTAGNDEIMQAIGRLQGKVEAMGDSLADMDGRLQSLEAVSNMGKGALWMALKIGGVLMLFAGGIAWLWERF
ncbi:MAG: hypothetical protein QF491_08525 [Alphaproteobacteria bacterium]|nr:hypothetical protein [Alphaproteobacteria bacterium]